MGKKKAILCFDCAIDCIEVGHSIFYPKSASEAYLRPEYGHKCKRYGHEYRYVCPKCGKEYIHDTSCFPHSEIWDINEFMSEFGGPQWNIKIIDGKEILTTRDAVMLKDLGSDKDFIELTPTELKRIIAERRSERRKK
jgi:hypothetical protein